MDPQVLGPAVLEETAGGEFALVRQIKESSQAVLEGGRVAAAH